MGADSLTKKNTNAPEFICPIWNFNDKRLHWASVVRGQDSLLFLTRFVFQFVIHSKEIGLQLLTTADKKDDSNMNFVWDFVVTSIQFLKTTVGLIFQVAKHCEIDFQTSSSLCIVSSVQSIVFKKGYLCWKPKLTHFKTIILNYVLSFNNLSKFKRK